MIAKDFLKQILSVKMVTNRKLLENSDWTFLRPDDLNDLRPVHIKIDN